MGIRAHNKDHLESHKAEASVRFQHAAAQPFDDPLRFWTSHPKEPVLVDLYIFRDGARSRVNTGGTWLGNFSGRPRLIMQLAPVIREITAFASPRTVKQIIFALRAWWRLFGRVEDSDSTNEVRIRIVELVSDITEIHRQCALDSCMGRKTFTNFLRIVNVARVVTGLRPLYWRNPEDSSKRRYLAPAWQVGLVRHALRRGWFNALDRWRRAERLLLTGDAQSVEEARLLTNYSRFQSAVQETKNPRPPISSILAGAPYSAFNGHGYSVHEMLAGFYPDARDIRMAFHLCLATTGWNAAVLLSLDVTEPFIDAHPKDPSRYLMYGFKARGGSEQTTQGLKKSKGSAGGVLLALIARSKPLRERLELELDGRKRELARLQSEGGSEFRISAQRAEVVRLELGVRSPWLYVTTKTREICWLSHRNFARGVGRRTESGASFLDEVVEEINNIQSSDKQISRLTASDFRDAFANQAYESSGGMVLYVMKALQHKNVRTTQQYLNNTVFKERTDKLFETFDNALWSEIKLNGRVDPTIIAKHCRDGNVTEDERRRLSEYRFLRRSRIGVGCKDPAHPPKHIAPNFQPTGTAMCPSHRCSLCLENAVIFSDSVGGLCKRLAELRYLRDRMSYVAFLESSFREEMENTEFILRSFDADSVKVQLLDWERKIDSGEHRVIEFY